MKTMKYFLILFGFEMITTLLCFGQWIQQNSDTQVNLNDVIMLDQQTAIAVGDSGKILKTVNAGQNWTVKFSQPHARWNALAFANASKGVVVGDSSKIAFTFNGGDNWIFIDSSNTLHLTAAAYMGETTLYVGDNWGTVFYSNDDGVTWNSTSFGNDPVMDIFFTESAFINYGGHIVLPHVEFETEDSGINWDATALPVTVWGYATGGDFSPSADVSFLVAGDGQFLIEPVILRKLISDTTWQKYIFMPLPPITGLLDVSVPSDQIAFACGTFGHILKTVDGGNFWDVDFNAISTDLTAIDFYDDSTGVVVGDSGTILFTTTGGTMGLNDDGEIPLQDFALYQNYPNPFNPTTTISYQLPVSSEIELTIYNLLGQPIKTLVDSKQPAGTHKVQWDGKNDEGKEAASGVYIYRIQSDRFIQSKKMLLIR